MRSFILVCLSFISFSLFAQNPLIIPPSISGNTFDLTLKEDSMQFYPGIYTRTMGVSFPILGPTLIFEKGEEVNVSFDNQLQDTTTIHWHGMHVPAHIDGGPHTPIPPNTVWNPIFTVMDHASTMWYHPHLMHLTNAHVQMGIAGFIIIKDAEEAMLDLPRTYGVDDFPIVFQTKNITADHQIDVDMAVSGFDSLLLVNGTVDPFLDAPAQVLRFRLLNGATERDFRVGLSNGQDFFVIGTDGGLLEEPVQLNRLEIAPGERYEILINLTGMENQSINVVNYGSEIPSGHYGTASNNISGMGGDSAIPGYAENAFNGADFTLLTLHVSDQTENPITSIPSSLVDIDFIENIDVDEERTILMAPDIMGQNTALVGPFTFNGMTFMMDDVNIEIPLGNKEVWTLTNQSMIGHPYHTHDVQFNILEINGNPPPAHMQGWKDVVMVPPMLGTVKYIAKFEDHSNPSVPYMYHCHILTHEEMGMMGQFVVVDDVSVSELKEIDTELTVYPNPATSFVSIGSKDDLFINKVGFYDILGQPVYIMAGVQLDEKIDISRLSAGVYDIEITTDHGVTFKRIVIK